MNADYFVDVISTMERLQNIRTGFCLAQFIFSATADHNLTVLNVLAQNVSKAKHAVEYHQRVPALKRERYLRVIVQLVQNL